MTSTLGTRGAYAKTPARREAIITAAIEVFAVSGYSNGSLREVAERAGLSQAGVLHHFSSKTELLTAVLTRRDELTAGDPGVRGLAQLRLMPGIVEHNMRTPGLVALFTILSAEASAPDHPAHQYFIERSVTADAFFRSAFVEAQEEGVLRPDVDPLDAARGLGSLMDGLQVYWLYHRDHDMAADIRAYIQALLTVPL